MLIAAIMMIWKIMECKYISKKQNSLDMNSSYADHWTIPE